MNIAVEQGNKTKVPSLVTGFNTASAAYEDTPKQRVLTANEELGLQKSGYVIKSISIVGNTGEYAEDDEDSEKNTKKRQRDRVASRLFDWSGADILGGLSKGIEFDKALISLESGLYKPVEEKDILRNAKGDVVKTLEEKQEMERNGRNCSALLSQDEIAHDPATGQMITRQDAMINMIIQERIDYKTRIFAKVEKGEMTADNLPEDLKKELTDRQYSNKPYTPTFYDRIHIGQSALSLKHSETNKPVETSGSYTFRQEPYVAAPAPAI